MTTSLHIKKVLLSTGGLTIILKFNITLVVMILCRILYSFPMVSLDDMLKYQDMRNTVSMREYFCYKSQICSNDNVILMGGRLFQQFVVDTYIKIETTHLVFVEKNQTKI
uniref:Uncharacterized protein n=1 Tax=Lactuca sativa TaxID=4236 RepID=A0A9R1W979_LACSA|nr:hypothetical protein LSAT_V11C300146790 [Lactuca sativa]